MGAFTNDDELEYAERDRAYVVPAMVDAPYVDTYGWAPTIRTGLDGTPDAMRLDVQPTRTKYPDPRRAPDEHYRPLDADDAMRHSVENIDADGWEEQKGSRRFAPHAMSTPVPESRLTQRMAPRSYSFFRPFAGPPRLFTGLHFSMADHRRTYDILGMQPVRRSRNTFRLEPPAWDTDVVDYPPATAPLAPPSSSASSRTWRLA